MLRRVAVGLVFLLSGLVACAGKQQPDEEQKSEAEQRDEVEVSEKTVIDGETGTFAIPNSPYRRGVEVYEHVTVLPRSVMEKTRGGARPADDGRLVFPRGLAPVEGLDRGDVVLSRHDGGFARKIRGIEWSEESVTFRLAGVKLNEVVARGDFYFGPTRQIDFANGEAYAPPETFSRLPSPEQSEWSERQNRFAVDTRDANRVETLFRLGPRAEGTENLVADTGNLTPYLNEWLERVGLRNQLEFVHQLLDVEMAVSARMRMCRGEACRGGAPESGIAKLERFDVRQHGWIDTNTRLRYRSSSPVVPDINANDTPDWREEGLADYRKIHVLSTRADDKSIFDFPKADSDASIRRQFEIVPGVNLRINYDLTVGVQVLGERPMDVETGFEVTAQGGCRENPGDRLAPWFSATGVGGTCGRTTEHEWHTRPEFAAETPTGDTLRLRVRVEPEVTVELTGGIEGGARAVPFGAVHRFDQHVSAPQVGNCATVAETAGYGVAETSLASMLLGDEGKALGVEDVRGRDATFELRLASATDQLAVPDICNPAWTPTIATMMSDDEKTCGGSRQLSAPSPEKTCPMLRVEEASNCRDRDNDPIDVDDDGVPQRSDGCPCIFNPAQIDSDGNGETDRCDSDADESDGEDWKDNCPTIINPDQKEGPVEGVGAACTPDTTVFCGSSPARVQPVEGTSQDVSCRFQLSHLPEDTAGDELRGYLHIDNDLGTQPAKTEGDHDRTYYGGNPEFREYDGFASGGDEGDFLSGEALSFERNENREAVVELPKEACRAYRTATSDWEPRGYDVSFRLAGACISGDATYRDRMMYCPHARQSIDVGQDVDDWPDPPTPNPAQGYDPRSGGSILRADGDDFDLTTHDFPVEEWDRCPFHENPVAKGAESSEHQPNDGAVCRVKLDQGEAFGDEAMSSVEHPSPVFTLEFPDGVTREDWNGDYPLIDYSGDGVLAHHPGYPQPCRPADIDDCEQDGECNVPRCSDNCPTIPNPHQQDRNDNGVGDRCEHADSEPVDRESDRGERFGVDNPHYIDSTAELNIYDSDQDDVPDHADSCPWDWNGGQVNGNRPDVERPKGMQKYDANPVQDGEQLPHGYDNWHVDRRGNACDPDLDADGLGNVCDSDIDGDRIPNVLDYCPELALRVEDEGPTDRNSNRPCADSDDDGIQGQPKDYPPLGDEEVSEDWYREGWAGFDELDRTTFTSSDGASFAVGADNCPTVANPGQFDLDHDGVGDACDPDLDGDATTNDGDTCPQAASEPAGE